MLNSVTLIARLKDDPKEFYSNNPNEESEDKKVRVVGTLCVEENGRSKKVNYFRYFAFGEVANYMKRNFKKGYLIWVKGRLQQGTEYVYAKTPDDGFKKVAHNTTDVIVEFTGFAETKTARLNRLADGQPIDELDSGFLDLPDGFGDDNPFM